MVDSNFANPASTRVQWPRQATPRATPTNSTFSRFCWGTALGLVIGAFAGAFLPDRLLASGSFQHADFGPASAPNLTRQNKSPTPTSELADIQASAEAPHTWDAD